MIDPERVVVTVEAGVADVRLVRADKRNALDRRMFQAIIEAGEQITADRSVRVVVLSGDGKAFCAGLDTSLFVAMAERDPGVDQASTTRRHDQRDPGRSGAGGAGCGSTWHRR